MIVTRVGEMIAAGDLAAIRPAAQRTGMDLRRAADPDAGHAFFGDARPDAYDVDAAGEAWPETIRFLERQLGGGQP